MDHNKFEASVQKFKAQMQELQCNRRVTQVIGPEFREVLLPNQKRLRVVANEAPPMQSVAEDLILSSDSEDEQRPLFTYPEGRGGIAIYPADIALLEDGRFLNDNIINVVLNWMVGQKICAENRSMVRVCDSHLVTQLVRGIAPTTTAEETEKRYGENIERVKRWYRKGGPFDKAMTYIPVCEEQHWYLLAILVDQTTEPWEVTLFKLDSLRQLNRERGLQAVARLVKDQLPNAAVRIHQMDVPQQENGYDCGVHVIHNTWRFLSHTQMFPNTTESALIATIRAPPSIISRNELRELFDEMAVDPAAPEALEKLASPVVEELVRETETNDDHNIFCIIPTGGEQMFGKYIAQT